MFTRSKVRSVKHIFHWRSDPERKSTFQWFYLELHRARLATALHWFSLTILVRFILLLKKTCKMTVNPQMEVFTESRYT